MKNDVFEFHNTIYEYIRKKLEKENNLPRDGNFMIELRKLTDRDIACLLGEGLPKYLTREDI